jgi:hypothetical protein
LRGLFISGRFALPAFPAAQSHNHDYEVITMYRSEYTLGIIASVLNTIAAALLLIGLLAVALFGGTAERIIAMFLENATVPFLSEAIDLATGIAALAITVVLMLTVAATITGFIGASKLNKNDKSGAALLLVSAGLSLLSAQGIFAMILLLIGGVMALDKRAPVQP